MCSEHDRSRSPCGWLFTSRPVAIRYNSLPETLYTSATSLGDAWSSKFIHPVDCCMSCHQSVFIIRAANNFLPLCKNVIGRNGTCSPPSESVVAKETSSEWYVHVLHLNIDNTHVPSVFTAEDILNTLPRSAPHDMQRVSISAGSGLCWCQSSWQRSFPLALYRRKPDCMNIIQKLLVLTKHQIE